MKKILLTILIMFAIGQSNAQTAFWTENFGTDPTCNVFATANNMNPSGNGIWSVVSTGSNSANANDWFISPVEAGMGVGNCGDGCSNNPTLINRTLHISTYLGDLGATYVAGSGYETDLRAQSPTINCSGKSNITLSFSYIMYGVVNVDYARAYYSPDNGTTWVLLGAPPQTPTASCSGQGLWTSYSVALPATANNNPTVKVGFRWVNTDPTGGDPSIAVDDVTLLSASSSTVTMNPTFSLQTSICRGDSALVIANTGTTAATGYTWSSSPTGPLFAAPNASATYVKFNTAGTYSIILVAASGTVTGTTGHTIVVNPSPTIGVSSTTLNLCSGQSATLNATGGVSYTWTPGSVTGSSIVVSPTINTTYMCTGSSSLSCKSTTLLSITVTTCSGGGTGLNANSINDNVFSIYPNPLNDKMTLKAGNENLSNVKVELTDVLGKKLLFIEFSFIQAGSSQSVNTSILPKGVYFVNVKANGKEQAPIKIIKE